MITSSIVEKGSRSYLSQDHQLTSRMDNSIAIICSNPSGGPDLVKRAFIVSVDVVRPLVSGYLAESIRVSFLCAAGSFRSSQRSFKRYLSMSRGNLHRHGFPRNFGFKAMVDAVHIGHSTTSPVMAENMTDLGVGDASGSRQENVSKINFLKVAMKKIKREGSGIRFIPFRSSSEGWISFREYESRLDNHRTKSEANIQVESVTPDSEARETIQRIRYDETQLDQLPTLEKGHVRKIVTFLEQRLPAARITRQKLMVKEFSDEEVNIGNDTEQGVGQREVEQANIDTKVPKDVVQNVSSFRPLHFSNHAPNPEGELNLQRPVAVFMSAGGPSAGQKINMSADDKVKGVGGVDAVISPYESEKYAQHELVEQEVGAKGVLYETQGIGSGYIVNKKGVKMIPREAQRHERRFYIRKRDNKDNALTEEEANEVGDTSETGRATMGSSVKLGKISEGSKEVKAIGTEISGAGTPDTNELNKMPCSNDLNYESSQRSAATGRMMNASANQNTPCESEEEMPMTESIRTDGRSKRRKERLLGLLTSSFHRP